MIKRRHLTLLATIVAAGPLMVAACGSSGEAGSSNDSSGSGTGSGAANAGGGDSSGVGGSFSSGAGAGGQGGLDECAGEMHEGNLTPVDVVIVLDQSGSMSGDTGGQTVWQLVTDAITTFVQAPESADMGVGLQYFPLPDGSCDACATCFSPNVQLTDQTTQQCCCSYPTGVSCSGANGSNCPTGGICFNGGCVSGGANATCNATDYASLDVAIDSVANNGATIISSLASHGPVGLTPTGPALQGAIDAASVHAAQNPDHAVAVVLASDGVPTECAPQDISQIAAIASTAAAASPAVNTYVIGIGDVSALNAIAQAGGTQQAYLVSASGNAGQQFLDALEQIQGSLLTCEFDIPQPRMGELDYGKVNVQFTPAGSSTETIPQVPSAGDCTAAGGWYYDDANNPSQILLCDASCDSVKAVNEASIEIVLGCKTVVF